MYNLRPRPPRAGEFRPGGERTTRPVPSLKRIDTLQKSHSDALVRAIANTCETEIAKSAFAQVLDGFPVGPRFDGGNLPLSWPVSHPSVTQHLELGEGVTERLAEFRCKYDVRNLALESEAMIQYNSAAPDSRRFNTKLIELTARATHQIAVGIAMLDESRHKDDEFGTWVPLKSDKLWWQINPNGPPPNGGCDMAGYWAENKIFGGVLVFDRRSPADTKHNDLAGEIDHDGVYLHPERRGVTYRICKLLDGQKKQLVDFLRANTEESVHICPLPLAVDQTTWSAWIPKSRPQKLASTEIGGKGCHFPMKGGIHGRETYCPGWIIRSSRTGRLRNQEPEKGKPDSTESGGTITPSLSPIDVANASSGDESKARKPSG